MVQEVCRQMVPFAIVAERIWREHVAGPRARGGTDMRQDVVDEIIEVTRCLPFFVAGNINKLVYNHPWPFPPLNRYRQDKSPPSPSPLHTAVSTTASSQLPILPRLHRPTQSESTPTFGHWNSPRPPVH